MDNLCYLCRVFVMHCCPVVTCWVRTDLLALVCDIYCDFVTFPCGILGQVWYLIVSIPDLCNLSNFEDDLVHLNLLWVHLPMCK